MNQPGRGVGSRPINQSTNNRNTMTHQDLHTLALWLGRADYQLSTRTEMFGDGTPHTFIEVYDGDVDVVNDFAMDVTEPGDILKALFKRSRACGVYEGQHDVRSTIRKALDL